MEKSPDPEPPVFVPSVEEFDPLLYCFWLKPTSIRFPDTRVPPAEGVPQEDAAVTTARGLLNRASSAVLEAHTADIAVEDAATAAIAVEDAATAAIAV